jgi:hypothetical protein
VDFLRNSGNSEKNSKKNSEKNSKKNSEKNSKKNSKKIPAIFIELESNSGPDLLQAYF